jgi:MFS family permease
VFKTALLTILTYDALSWTDMDPGLLNNLIPGLFILPFFLFSATSGQLADKLEKGRVARFVKLLEIAIMGIAAYGWMTHHLWLLIAAVVGMGIHSTLFGPVKYAYLPQQLKREELVGGNGLIEMGTFVGILLGKFWVRCWWCTSPGGLHLVAGITIGIAVLGWLASLRIPPSPAPVPELKVNWNPSPRPCATSAIRAATGRCSCRCWAIPGSGSMAPSCWRNSRSTRRTTCMATTASSCCCWRCSRWARRGFAAVRAAVGHKVEIGLVPFGSIGLSVFGLELYFASQAYVTPSAMLDLGGFLAQGGSWRILFDCLGIGLFGGFYIVPLFALIQTRCDPAHVSRTIAGMNIMNALFMVVSALVAMVLLKAGLTIPQIFLATAIMNGVVAVYIFSLVPEFLIRFLAWLLIHTFYRVRIVNGQAIPEEGRLCWCAITSATWMRSPSWPPARARCAS